MDKDSCRHPEIWRTWAMPNRNTFRIPPIKAFVEAYICKTKMTDGYVIVDPFANSSRYGTITNDINPAYETDFHMDALAFLETLEDASADLVLYDPPYSARQASEVYRSFGKEKLESGVTNMKYWAACKDQCARILKKGGICLSFGWNTNGLGKGRGCQIESILIVAHGGSRHDTLCVAERKTGQGILHRGRRAKQTEEKASG